MKLGDKITIDSKLSRRGSFKEGCRDEFKTWQTVKLPKPVKAVIVGQRTVSNGFSSWEGHEIGHVWNPQTYVKTYLVVTNINQNPFHILREDYEVDSNAPE